MAILLVCLGVVIGKTLAWIGIAVALTILVLFALAGVLRPAGDSDGPVRDLLAAKLREGTRLLAILRANSPDLAAAIEPEVEVWWRSAQDDLPSELRAQFELAAPWQHRGRARARLEQVLDSGTRCLGKLLEGTQGTEMVLLPEMPRELLREGIRLRGMLDMRSEPDAKCAAGSDPVYDWTRRTWEALERDEPLTAREFFGDATPYAGGFLITAYGIELEKVGRRAYLDCRITILSSVVEPKAVGEKGYDAE